ncbi:unnamed protein product [Larinioides sclopetarius]|uniref:Uncharacterized protein n=1 Tax=Larinioides sclopetarius TaxID=280406 RepID=A0AAV2A679_9ARAC
MYNLLVLKEPPADVVFKILSPREKVNIEMDAVIEWMQERERVKRTGVTGR